MIRKGAHVSTLFVEREQACVRWGGGGGAFAGWWFLFSVPLERDTLLLFVEPRTMEPRSALLQQTWIFSEPENPRRLGIHHRKLEQKIRTADQH
ncbi:hypothetical protein CSHISOI_03797 [Colletotrichum shisoi]|uniref:Uncharacterized protein n=1 Tax=Colletotrichum shisoi TaxID=2078593 RepID=A0A5Q4BZK2_9PEZI|nr:hypothetical protein CSHISOI_03797 [Colletotrichum shisoi]